KKVVRKRAVMSFSSSQVCPTVTASAGSSLPASAGLSTVQLSTGNSFQVPWYERATVCKTSEPGALLGGWDCGAGLTKGLPAVVFSLSTTALNRASNFAG